MCETAFCGVWERRTESTAIVSERPRTWGSASSESWKIGARPGSVVVRATHVVAAPAAYQLAAAALQLRRAIRAPTANVLRGRFLLQIGRLAGGGNVR